MSTSKQNFQHDFPFSFCFYPTCAVSLLYKTATFTAVNTSNFKTAVQRQCWREINVYVGGKRQRCIDTVLILCRSSDKLCHISFQQLNGVCKRCEEPDTAPLCSYLENHSISPVIRFLWAQFYIVFLIKVVVIVLQTSPYTATELTSLTFPLIILLPCQVF